MDTEVLSVTITIENNIDYINDKAPHLIEYEEFDDDLISLYPFEFSITISRFKTIFCGLGVDIDLKSDIIPNGSIDPKTLLKLLDRVVPELCLRSGRIRKGKEESPITEDFLIVFEVNMYEIAEEAIARGERVIWE